MADDYSADINTTGVILVGGSTTGMIEWNNYFDRDWFKVALAANTSYLFALKGSKQSVFNHYYGDLEGDRQFMVSLAMYDATGKQLGEVANDPENGPILAFTAPAAGDYFVGVRTYDAHGSYTLLAALQPPDDYPGSIATPGELTVGTSTRAVFEMEGDRDWFKVYVEAGKFYHAMATKEQPGDVWPYNYQFYDASGVVVSYGSLEPTQSGYYFLGLEGRDTGAYSIAVLERQDDYQSHIGTKGLLSAGAALTGEIQFSGDDDWFRIDAQAGDIVTIELSGVPADQSGLSMGVTDLSYASMDVDHGHSVNGAYFVTFRPQQGQQYVAHVSGNGLKDSRTSGPYTIRMNSIKDDHADDAAGATPLALGAAGDGQIQWRKDIDAFAVQLHADTLYRFDIAQAKPLTSGILWLKLTDSAGGFLKGTDGINSEQFFSFVPAASGTYYVRTGGDIGVFPFPYSVTAAAATDDVGSGKAGAATLPINSERFAALEPGRGDRDWFATPLKAGVSYFFTLEGAADNVGSLGTHYDGALLKILNSAGEIVASRSDPSSAPLAPLPFVPAADGVYYAEVSGKSTGTYRIGAFEKSYDDVGNSQATASYLPNATKVERKIEKAGDVDAFKIDVIAGHHYVLYLDPVYPMGMYGGTAGLTIAVTDSSLAPVATSSPGIPFTRLYTQFEAATTGTYHLAVTGSQPGRYTLSSTSAGKDDFANDYAGAKPITDGDLQGSINYYYDSDAFLVNLVRNTTYTFDMLTAADGGGTLVLPHGPFMTITQNGTFHDGQTGNRITFTPKASGEYLLKLASIHQYALGTYTLRMATGAPGDTTPPVIVGYSHAPGSVNVGLNDTFTFTFSEAIKPWGLPTLRDEHGVYLPLAYPGNFTSTVSGSTLTVDPAIPLHADGTYTLTMGAGLFRDNSDNGSAAVTYTFKTITTSPPPPPPPPPEPPADTTAPALLSQTHAPGSADVALYDTLTFKFSEAIAPGSPVVLTDENGVAVSLASPLVSGDTLTIDPTTFLLPGATYTINLGSVKDLAGNAMASPAAFTFTTIAASSGPTAGNDFLAGSGKGMTLAGGAGVDTAIYRNAASMYAVDRIEGKATVTAVGAPAGDTLTGIERLMFNGSAVALDIDGTGGQAYRLYQAAFNRTPDQAGVGYWIAMMDKGTGLTSVASHFLDSPEFLKMYGTGLSDTAFVGKLYANVLHRPQDQAGAEFWTGAMAKGVTRAQVLEHFSESAENQAALIGVIGDGFTYIPLA